MGQSGLWWGLPVFLFATMGVFACVPDHARSGACSGDDQQYGQAHYACQGTSLVSSAPSCFAGEPSLDRTTDCALAAKVCVVESFGYSGRCAQPCDSDASCAKDEYCAAATADRPRTCAPAYQRPSPCDASDPTACTSEPPSAPSSPKKEMGDAAPGPSTDAGPKEGCTEASPVLVTEGSFEGGGTTCGDAWTSGIVYSKATSVAKSGSPRCGAHSCRLCGKGIFDIGMAKAEPAAGIYQLRAWLRATGDAPAPYTCWANIDAGGGGAGGNGVSPSTAAWAMTKVEFNLAGGTSEVLYRISCQAVGDQEACVLVDDVVDSAPQQ